MLELIAYQGPTLTAADFEYKKSPWRTTPTRWNRDKSKAQRTTLRRLRFEANRIMKATGKRPHVRVIHWDDARTPPAKPGTFGVINNVVFVTGK